MAATMAFGIARVGYASHWLVGGMILGRSFSPVRAFSSSSDLVLTTIDEESGIATIQLNRPPVNSLSLEM